jgi:hypothetical protein
MKSTGLRFGVLCGSLGLPVPAEEYRFHGTRKWRFDYAWVPQQIALEIEGGVFAGGRHSRGAGFRADLTKYNTAAAMGWRVLRVLPEQLETPETFDYLKACLGKTG